MACGIVTERGDFPFFMAAARLYFASAMVLIASRSIVETHWEDENMDGDTKGKLENIESRLSFIDRRI
jgi:hypothetical protein